MGIKSEQGDLEALKDFNWQGGIKAFLQLGSITLPEEQNEDAYEFMDDLPFTHFGIPIIKKFLDISENLIESSAISDEKNYIEVTNKVIDIIDRAIYLKLVEKEEYPSDIANDKGVKLYHYSLNSNGVDTALRLQEHDDSEKRHVTLTRISMVSLFVSFIAVSVPGFSAYLLHERGENNKVVTPPVVISIYEPTQTSETKNN